MRVVRVRPRSGLGQTWPNGEFFGMSASPRRSDLCERGLNVGDTTGRFSHSGERTVDPFQELRCSHPDNGHLCFLFCEAFHRRGEGEERSLHQFFRTRFAPRANFLSTLAERSPLTRPPFRAKAHGQTGARATRARVLRTRSGGCLHLGVVTESCFGPNTCAASGNRSASPIDRGCPRIGSAARLSTTRAT